MLVACIYGLFYPSTSYITVNYVSSSMTWKAAEDNCDLVSPWDNVTFDAPHRIQIRQLSTASSLPVLGWVGGYISYTKWIDFVGCTLYSLPEIKSMLEAIPDGWTDPVLYCYYNCNATRFAVYDGHCLCTSPGIGENRVFCQSYLPLDTGGISGTKNGCLCEYLPLQDNSTLTVNDNSMGQCSSLMYNYNNPQVTSSKSNCDSKQYYSCYNATLQSILHFNESSKTPFWIAAARCQIRNMSFAYSQFLFTFNVSYKYWGSSFRKRVIHLDHDVNASLHHCSAVERQNDGTFSIVPRSCTDTIPGLCNHVISPPDSGILGNAVVVSIVVIAVCIIMCAFVVIFVLKLKKRRRKNVTDDHQFDNSRNLNVPQRESYEFAEIRELPPDNADIYNVLHEEMTTGGSTAAGIYDTTTTAKSENDYDVMCGQNKHTEILDISPEYDMAHVRHDSAENEYDQLVKSWKHQNVTELSDYDIAHVRHDSAENDYDQFVKSRKHHNTTELSDYDSVGLATSDSTEVRSDVTRESRA